MPDFQEQVRLLAPHRQLFEDSCCASGMEMIIKLHGKVAGDWHEFQTLYRGQHDKVGFGKLNDLKAHGVTASGDHLRFADFLKAVEAETKAGRFPIFSFRSLFLTSLEDFSVHLGPSHVYVCLSDGQTVRYLSKGFPDRFVEIADINKSWSTICSLDTSISTVNVVTYTV